jgi:hypothetical protein
MEELSGSDARKLLNTFEKDKNVQIPSWFKPEHLKYLFPVENRPIEPEGNSFVPSSPDDIVRTSVRREEDETRRKAMHELVTNWDKAARTTARSIVDHIFRGVTHSKVQPPPCIDRGVMDLFHSLIPDAEPPCEFGIEQTNVSSISYLPVHSVGGYSVTDTVGPLSMLSRLCRSREPAIIWVKNKVRMSHGKRCIQILKREGQIVLFDRFMNIVFVPRGRASDRWEFIRGSMIALVQISR